MFILPLIAKVFLSFPIRKDTSQNVFAAQKLIRNRANLFYRFIHKKRVLLQTICTKGGLT